MYLEYEATERTTHGNMPLKTMSYYCSISRDDTALLLLHEMAPFHHMHNL